MHQNDIIDIFIVKFEPISHLFLMFSLLILKRRMFSENIEEQIPETLQGKLAF